MSDSSSFLKRRTRSTFFTSLFSISLVLFFLGLFSGASIFLNFLLDEAQEEVEMLVLVSDELKGESLENFENDILQAPYTKQLSFVSKDEAAEEFFKDIGESFEDIMEGINPMRASFKIKLKKSYIQSDSINFITSELLDDPMIADVEYPIKDMLQLQENIGRIIPLAGIVALIVIIIAYFIVSSTIRLAIFSKRLVIRSMQLIGATNRFIRRPFVNMGILQGFLGACISNVLLILLIILLSRTSETLKGVEKYLSRPEFMILFGGIVIFGTLLGWFSSRMAVNRFLNKKLDDLI